MTIKVELFLNTEWTKIQAEQGISKLLREHLPKDVYVFVCDMTLEEQNNG